MVVVVVSVVSVVRWSVGVVLVAVVVFLGGGVGAVLVVVVFVRFFRRLALNIW